MTCFAVTSHYRSWRLITKPTASHTATDNLESSYRFTEK
jgi:hypothetical protein